MSASLRPPVGAQAVLFSLHALAVGCHSQGLFGRLWVHRPLLVFIALAVAATVRVVHSCRLWVHRPRAVGGNSLDVISPVVAQSARLWTATARLYVML